MPERRPDPYAPLKDNSWRELADIDHLLAKGEIDEAEWHRAIADLVVPAYRRDLFERLRDACERLKLIRRWGHRISGRSERSNRRKPAVDYRVLWVDA